MIDCEHKWVYQSSHYSREPGSYNATWTRVDIYFCEKCCEQKDVTRETFSRDMPIWWQH